MVSLNPRQWSTLLGELNMKLLEDMEVEGDIPRPALIRFLTKHKGLQRIRIRCNMVSDRAIPSRSQHEDFLPSLLTLRAPLAVCCDIVERVSPMKLFEVEVEVSRLQPFDPLLLRLMENLGRFRKLDNFGFRVGPSPQSVAPQDRPDNHDWDGHPARRVRQVRTLSFVQTQSRLSPGDIVRPPSPLRYLPYLI
jgi:hypothetical protein